MRTSLSDASNSGTCAPYFADTDPGCDPSLLELPTRESLMIARIWRGWTRHEDTEAYAKYLLATGIATMHSTAGNRGAYAMSRRDGDRTEFLVVSLWDTREAITAFAGEDIDRAVFFPEDDRYLIDREITVQHYDIH